MKDDLAIALDMCLEEVLAGSTVEECLARFPEHRSELEPLLLAATQLKALPKAEPRQSALRNALLEMGAALPSRKESRIRSGRAGWHRWGFLWPRPALLRLATIALAFVVAVLGVSIASARSEPGDLLYPLKLVTERVTFALATQPDRKAELRLTFADRRLNELVSSVQKDAALDPELLRALLQQAELALDEARPLPEEQFGVLLSRIDHFNSYQKDVFEQLAPRVADSDTAALNAAISLCDKRGRWMQKMWRDSESGKAVEREWGPGCRCN
jgi:hypothetical protein